MLRKEPFPSLKFPMHTLSGLLISVHQPHCLYTPELPPVSVHLYMYGGQRWRPCPPVSRGSGYVMEMLCTPTLAMFQPLLPCVLLSLQDEAEVLSAACCCVLQAQDVAGAWERGAMRKVCA